MIARWPLMLACLLPIVGLSGAWATLDRRAHSGTEWDVPIHGYDPSDVLRGHFVTFTYDWPGVGDAPLYAAAGLCLSGRAPLLQAVKVIESVAPAGQGRCRAFVRNGDGWNNGWHATGTLTNGRLFIDQAQAARLQRGLTDPARQAFLHFRLRPDGQIIPLTLRLIPRVTPAPVH